KDELASIADTFALIGLRRPEFSDLCRDLANLLLVDAGDHDLGWLRAHDLDAFGYGKGHVVAIAELELEAWGLHRGPIGDTGDLKLLDEALGHPGHQVRDQRPRHAPHGARILRILAHGDLNAPIPELGDDVVHQDVLELALGPLHRNLLAIHR